MPALTAQQAWANFTGMADTDPAIGALSAASHAATYAKNASVITQADAGRHVYLLTSGHLRAVRYSENGHEIWLSDIHAGELLGEMAALAEGARTSSVLATSPASAFRVSQSNFTAIMTAHGRVALAVSRMLAVRLKATSAQLSELVALPVASRLHAELVRMGQADKTDSERFLIHKAPTVSLLAQHIHATREATSRALGRLETRGLVQRLETGGYSVIAVDY